MNHAATSLGDLIDYPQPAKINTDDRDAVRSGEHIQLVISHRAKSRIVDGHIMRFDTTQEIVDVILQDQWDFSSFDFAEINYLTLTRPRVITTNEEKAHQFKIHSYDIPLLDDKHLTGKSLPIIERNEGIFLFPVDNNLHFQCIFIPQTSLIDGYEIGGAEPLTTGSGGEEHDHYLASILPSIKNIDELMHAISKQPAAPQVKLGQLLIKEHLISSDQLENALNYQEKNRHRPLGKILVQMGVISEEEIQLALTRKLAIPVIDLESFETDSEALNELPKTIIRKHNVVPIFRRGNELIVALENPLDKEAIAAARFNTKLHIETVMASRIQLEAYISKVFGEQAIDFSLEELENYESIDTSSEHREHDTEEVGENDNTILRLANKIILDAFKKGASDIHIEPYPRKQKAIVRFRVDGVMQEYFEVPANLRKPLISRYKIMAGLDISERRKPQDGKINFRRFSNMRLELRVATIPTVGDLEDVVMRLLADSKPKAVSDLGLTKSNLTYIEEIINLPYGLILVCGPTGSGKTTTLHSLLANINTGDRKIWTAEDPVEITQKGLRQVQVNPKIDFTFAKAMRSFLRADPDVIMVGEMRDEETASIGIEASLTGHLVFSTLHTNNAPESIIRLLDMGMDPFNFAYSLIGIASQRLARCLCKHCKQAEKLDSTKLADLAEEYLAPIFEHGTGHTNKHQMVMETIQNWQENFGDADGQITTYHTKGCDRCDHSGYKGRIAIHEVLKNNDQLRRIIRNKASVDELFNVAIETGMVTLKQDGIIKYLQGETDMIQIRKVCIS